MLFHDDTFYAGSLYKWNCRHCKQDYSSTLQRLVLHLHGIGKCGINPCPLITPTRREYLKSLPAYETRHPKRASTVSTNESRPKIMSQNDSTVQTRPKQSQLRQTTMFEGLDQNNVKIAYRYIGRFFYGCNLPFHPIDLPYFADMCKAIANCGPGFKPPSSYPIRTTILQEEKKNIQEALEVMYLHSKNLQPFAHLTCRLLEALRTAC